MAPKNKQKYFECDSVVNKLCGIFSANYCWPQEYEQELGSKNWSKIMTQNKEWFETKMWSQVVKKIPIVTNEDKDESAVRQINQCFFGLILKELDLLTFNETQYYESILDLFNDEISFGLMFWLKLCEQFNWRLIYVQMIGDHKHSNSLIEFLFNEINAKTNDKLFTNEEISYFYSLIECLVIKVMAIHIIEGKVCDKKLVDIHNNCRQKISQLSGDRFGSRLAIYNVLTQELIGFAFKLMSSDCVCDEVTEKQLSSIEELIHETFETIKTENERQLNNKKISKDIAIARDNYESLELINKQYFLTTNSKIELSSLERFYKYLNSNFPQEIQLSRFNCLAKVLTQRENPNYQPLIKILLSLGNFEKHKTLFMLINAIEVNNLKLVPNLTTKVIKTRDESSKKFFASLLYKSLKSLQNIDLKSRLNEFDIKNISEANCDVIKTLFNQITKDDKTELINELSQELIIGVYFEPFTVYDLILDLALHHNKAQIPLVSQLICGKLYPLSTFTKDGEKETFLMKFIIHKLVEKPSLQLVETIVKLITEIINFKGENGVDCVLSLEEFFFFIIKDECLAKSDVVWLKLLLLKQLIELSGDKSWDSLQTEPVPVLVYIIQFLDYFWRNSIRKQLVVDILNSILKQKMTRNLTEDELSHIDSLLSQRLPVSASTHRIYLAYIEERFPKPIKEVIDITNNVYHDQILHYASITKDFMWICDIYPEYHVFTDHIKKALKHILPSLIAEEWDQLFRFLHMYYLSNQVISLLREAIIQMDNEVDKKFMIQSLIKIVLNHLLIPKRNESVERPLSYEDSKYREPDLGLIFKCMASFDFLLLANDVRMPLREILIELAERIKNDSIDCYKLYSSENVLPPIAKEVLKTIYGYSYPT